MFPSDNAWENGQVNFPIRQSLMSSKAARSLISTIFLCLIPEGCGVGPSTLSQIKAAISHLFIIRISPCAQSFLARQWPCVPPNLHLFAQQENSSVYYDKNHCYRVYNRPDLLNFSMTLFVLQCLLMPPFNLAISTCYLCGYFIDFNI